MVTTNWEKIFTNTTSTEGLYPRYTKNSRSQTPGNQITLLKNWGTYLNKQSSPKEIQMAEKHLKKCSTSLAIWEMDIKTTLRFHLKQSEWLRLKTQETAGVGEDVEKEEHSSTAGELQDGTTTLEIILAVLQKTERDTTGGP